MNRNISYQNQLLYHLLFRITENACYKKPITIENSTIIPIETEGGFPNSVIDFFDYFDKLELSIDKIIKLEIAENFFNVYDVYKFAAKSWKEKIRIDLELFEKIIHTEELMSIVILQGPFTDDVLDADILEYNEYKQLETALEKCNIDLSVKSGSFRKVIHEIIQDRRVAIIPASYFDTAQKIPSIKQVHFSNFINETLIKKCKEIFVTRQAKEFIEFKFSTKCRSDSNYFMRQNLWEIIL
jgi:hypothetical protein